MIPLLIGIFLILLFIVFVVLSAATWRGWHVAAASLTFLATVGLVIVASMSQKTHMTWKDDHSKLSTELADEQATGVKLEFGDPTLVKGDEPSVIEVQTQLNQLLVDRGRVWRRCKMDLSAPANQITIFTAPLKEGGIEVDESIATDNGISQNMVLYGFRELEMPLPEGGSLPVPAAYLGEFRVDKAEPYRVTLIPTLPLDGQQVALIGDRDPTWALYEMMPLDSHLVFSKQDITGRPLDNTMEQAIFGDMDEQQIRQMFAATTGLAADDPMVTRLIAPYIKDGYAASDQDVSMFPTSIWQKLEFQKDRRDELDDKVDSPQDDMGLDSKYFDAGGYAIASRLRRGDEASFRANDIGVFPYGYDEDKQWVDSLVEEKTCQKICPIYVRSLRDYEEAFHDIQLQFVQRMEEISRTKLNTDNLNSAITNTLAQIAYRQGEREKLREDQAGFARDNEKMDQLVAALEQQKSSLTKELGDLYATNLALSKQLTIYNAQLTEEINRRAASVAVQ